jgi:hypothetical protein
MASLTPRPAVIPPSQTSLDTLLERTEKFWRARAKNLLVAVTWVTEVLTTFSSACRAAAGSLQERDAVARWRDWMDSEAGRTLLEESGLALKIIRRNCNNLLVLFVSEEIVKRLRKPV